MTIEAPQRKHHKNNHNQQEIAPSSGIVIERYDSHQPSSRGEKLIIQIIADW